MGLGNVPTGIIRLNQFLDLGNQSNVGFSCEFQVEKLFRKSVEFCNESDIWKLNVAHVLFMQENKFKEATGFYEPIVRKNFDRYVRQLIVTFLMKA